MCVCLTKNFHKHPFTNFSLSYYNISFVLETIKSMSHAVIVIAILKDRSTMERTPIMEDTLSVVVDEMEIGEA